MVVRVRINSLRKVKKSQPIDKDYYAETVLEYRTTDGYKGWIVKIRSLK